MQFTDAAIILSSRKYGESSAVVRVLAREHGVFAGVVRGANSKNNRGIIQSGNVVSSHWQARLSQQLGTFKIELLEAHAAHIMQDGAKLAALTSACAITELALPERHPYPKIFSALHEFLHTLTASDNWQHDYVKYEMLLLAESGFGLDLSECAATGRTDDLIYVSPKSGRAVCAEAGEPYKERMLPLPEFLLGKESPLPVGGRVREGEEKIREGGKTQLIKYARKLRTNQTEAEKKLWYNLRAHRFGNYGFRRQYPIDEKYIADFVCLEKKLIIELDGGQHTEQIKYDQQRTKYLTAKGFAIIRFWNNEIMENLDGVLTLISESLRSSPSLTLPRKREREQEVLAGMQLTGYFLEHWLLAPHGKKLPVARIRLENILQNIPLNAIPTLT